MLACIFFFPTEQSRRRSQEFSYRFVIAITNSRKCCNSFFNFWTLDVGILGGVVVCPGTRSDQCYNHILYAHDSCIKCLRLVDRGLVGNWWEIVQVH